MKWSTCVILAPAVVAVFLASKAAPQSKSSSSFLVKRCDENALQVPLAPGPVKEVVGSQFRLVLENGKARILIVVQDCSQLWFDGTDLGPTQYAHMWVLIEGPQDVRPVFGAQQTRPTMTWFSLFAGSTNAREREIRKAAGTAPDPINGVSVGRPGSQAGSRVALGAGPSYSWDVPPATAFVRLVGVNHDVYIRDAAGHVVLKRIQALGNLIQGPAATTLHVVGGTDPKWLIGPGDYPVMVSTFAPIWVRTMLSTNSSPPT